MKPLLHILGRVLKIAGVTALLLVLLVVGAAVAIFQNPKIILNEKNLRWAALHFEPQTGVHVEWDHLGIGFQSLSFLEKRFDFDFSGICVKQKKTGAREPFVSGCFPQLKFGAIVSLQGLKFRLPEIGPIQVTGERLLVDLSADADAPAAPAKAETKTASESSGDLLPAFLKGARLHRVDVAITRWVLKLTPTAAKGGETGWRGQIALRGASDHVDHERVHLGLEAEGQAYGADPKIKLKPAAKLGFNLDAGFDGIGGKINLLARDMLQSIPEAQVKDCAVDLERRAVSHGHLSLDCPVAVRIPLPPSLANRYERLKLPVHFGAHLTADLNSSTFPPAGSSRLDGKLHVALDPVLHPIFEGHGDVSAQLDGVPANFPKKWKLDTDFDLRLLVPKFQKLVTEMERTPWTVPAPFAVMQGSIELAAKGHANLEKAEVPITFQTRMGSKTQIFNLDGKGALDLTQVLPSPAGKIDFGLVLSDVALALPHLKLESPPRFVPDGRIKKIAHERRPSEAAGAAAPSPITYSFKVSTPEDKPLRLISNLAQSPVPIKLDLALESGSNPEGSVDVVPFDVEAFRRKAHIDHFNIDLTSPAEESGIDGAISVAYADYTVTINVINTLGKPVVKLTSDPPLPENQLWATLLFGAPLDALDEDQAQSVGATQAAVTDGAIGLASLYALASTPVERVGYNSTTGEVTAKVKLGEGTSLNVGSNGSNLGQVGVRRRLSKHWAIDTDLMNPADTTERSASAFLEWSYKY